MQFVLVARHSPEQCPAANGKIREIMKEAAKRTPEIARQLGVRVAGSYVLGPDHEVLAMLEADRIESVQEFALQTRMMQWNTVSIRAAWGMEEAIAKIDALPPIF